MNRDSFVFYRSYYEALGLISNPKVRAELALAIIEYGINGELSEGPGEIVGVAMALIRPQIDANNKRYENGVKGAEGGKKGGRPKKAVALNTSAGNEAPDENPTGDNDGITPQEISKPHRGYSENPSGVIEETPNENVDVDINVDDKKKISPDGDKEKTASGAAFAADGGSRGKDNTSGAEAAIGKALERVKFSAGQLAAELHVAPEEIVAIADEVAAQWRLTGEFDRRRPVSHMLNTISKKLKSGLPPGVMGGETMRRAADDSYQRELAAEREEREKIYRLDSAAELRAYMESRGLKPSDSLTSAIGDNK